MVLKKSDLVPYILTCIESTLARYYFFKRKKLLLVLLKVEGKITFNPIRKSYDAKSRAHRNLVHAAKARVRTFEASVKRRLVADVPWDPSSVAVCSSIVTGLARKPSRIYTISLVLRWKFFIKQYQGGRQTF